MRDSESAIRLSGVLPLRRLDNRIVGELRIPRGRWPVAVTFEPRAHEPTGSREGER